MSNIDRLAHYLTLRSASFAKLNRYLTYCYIFLVIYTPTISGNFIFSKYTLLILLTTLAITPYILRGDVSILKIISHKYLRALMVAVLISSLYIAGMQIIRNIDFSGVSGLRLVQNNIINIMIINAAVIYDKLRKYGYSTDQMFSLLLKFGALQGIICILSLFYSPLRELAVYLYTTGGGSNQFVIAARIYGVSGDYTYGTPIYHGLLAGLAFYQSIRFGKRYYAYICLILASVLLNGRTGLLLFILIALASAMYTIYKEGSKKFFPLITAFAIALVFIISATPLLPAKNRDIIGSFITDTANLVNARETTGNYSVLIEDSIKFPEGSDLYLGTGRRVYKSGQTEIRAFKSDVGYVNDVYMGGMVYAAIMYVLFLLYLTAYSKPEKFIMLTLFSMVMLANFKGEIYRSSIVLFLVIFYKLIYTGGNRG